MAADVTEPSPQDIAAYIKRYGSGDREPYCAWRTNNALYCTRKSAFTRQEQSERQVRHALVRPKHYKVKQCGAYCWRHAVVWVQNLIRFLAEVDAEWYNWLALYVHPFVIYYVNEDGIQSLTQLASRVNPKVPQGIDRAGLWFHVISNSQLQYLGQLDAVNLGETLAMAYQWADAFLAYIAQGEPKDEAVIVYGDLLRADLVAGEFLYATKLFDHHDVRINTVMQRGLYPVGGRGMWHTRMVFNTPQSSSRASSRAASRTSSSAAASSGRPASPGRTEKRKRQPSVPQVPVPREQDADKVLEQGYQYQPSFPANRYDDAPASSSSSSSASSSSFSSAFVASPLILYADEQETEGSPAFLGSVGPIGSFFTDQSDPSAELGVTDQYGGFVYPPPSALTLPESTESAESAGSSSSGAGEGALAALGRLAEDLFPDTEAREAKAPAAAAPVRRSQRSASLVASAAIARGRRVAESEEEAPEEEVDEDAEMASEDESEPGPVSRRRPGPGRTGGRRRSNFSGTWEAAASGDRRAPLRQTTLTEEFGVPVQQYRPREGPARPRYQYKPGGIAAFLEPKPKAPSNEETG